MEYFVLGFFVVLLTVYLTDRKYWNGVITRGSKIVRANITAKKPIKEIEATAEKSAFDDWENEFKGVVKKPDEKPLPHEIVRTYYEDVGFGYGAWPHWKCKCGVSGRSALGGGSYTSAEREARRKAAEHVDMGNRTEEMLRKNNGKFAF